MLHHANMFIVKDNLYDIKVVPVTIFFLSFINVFIKIHEYVN